MNAQQITLYRQIQEFSLDEVDASPYVPPQPPNPPNNDIGCGACGCM
jgi:hypothetical protein